MAGFEPLPNPQPARGASFGCCPAKLAPRCPILIVPTEKMDSKSADWFAIALQGLFGAFLGLLAGGLLVMHRGTKFMANDEQSSLIMVAGCIVAGDSLLIQTRVIPPDPLRHTAFSVFISRAIVVVGTGIATFGLARYYYLYFIKIL